MSQDELIDEYNELKAIVKTIENEDPEVLRRHAEMMKHGDKMGQAIGEMILKAVEYNMRKQKAELRG